MPHYELSKVLMEHKGRTHQKGQQGLNLAVPENFVAYLQIHFMSALPHTPDSTIMGWVPSGPVPLLTLLFVPIFNHIRTYVRSYIQHIRGLVTAHSIACLPLACATSTTNSLFTHSTFPSPPSPPFTTPADQQRGPPGGEALPLHSLAGPRCSSVLHLHPSLHPTTREASLQ